MKADALTELECSVSQRRLVLRHIPEKDMENRDYTYDEFAPLFESHGGPWSVVLALGLLFMCVLWSECPSPVCIL